MSSLWKKLGPLTNNSLRLKQETRFTLLYGPDTIHSDWQSCSFNSSNNENWNWSSARPSKFVYDATHLNIGVQHEVWMLCNEHGWLLLDWLYRYTSYLPPQHFPDTWSWPIQCREKKKKRFKIFEIISRKSSKRVFIAIWCQVVPSAVVADGVVIALIKEAKAHFEKSRFINLTTIVLMTNRNLSRIDLK